MKLRSILSALLLIGALAGLIAGPLAQASLMSAKPMPSSTAMADGMPCCPDESPSQDCQKSCPLMAMCANQTLLDVISWHVSVPMQLLGVTWPLSDMPLAGIDSIPPPRPPRSIV